MLGPARGRRRADRARRCARSCPSSQGRVELAVGKAYGANVPIAPRVLDPARRRGADRARPQRRPLADLPPAVDARCGPGWASEPVPLPEPHEGYAELVRRWLRTFGPGTAADIQWWLGATVGAVRRRWPTSGAVEVVARRRRRPAGCCPTTSTPAADVEPWAALLPVLDPTVDGLEGARLLPRRRTRRPLRHQRQRRHHRLVDGRVVGCWVQDADGVVAGRTCSRTSARRARAALDGGGRAARPPGWTASGSAPSTRRPR